MGAGGIGDQHHMLRRTTKPSFGQRRSATTLVPCQRVKISEPTLLSDNEIQGELAFGPTRGRSKYVYGSEFPESMVRCT